MPAAGNWICLARIFTTGPQRSKSGLRHEAKRLNREIRQIREGSPQSASFFAWFAYFAVTFFSCVFRSSIIHHQSQGPPRTRDVPLSRGRVARIVTEFWARTTPQDGATRYANRNKEFLAGGAFYLFNCCTNVDSQDANGQRKQRHHRGAGEMSSPRRQGVGTRTSMMVADSGGTRAKPGCFPSCPEIRLIDQGIDFFGV
jgi:hypothetical protein